MKKRDKKHEKRVKKLIVGVFLCTMLLVVSTYAWFIGMKTVNVSSFDIKISAIDQLTLSLDGEKFYESVTINDSNYNKATFDDNDTGYKVYSGNTNVWAEGGGLVPMSSIGKIDKEASRMILYEKGSLTATPGGYRLMTSRVRNTKADGKEDHGYVAFDLFIRNLSGNEYYGSVANGAGGNEEAIYLTRESSVGIGNGGVNGTGIENSIRVGFAQIGRVAATTDEAAIITGITCADNASNGVTGLCESRDAQIWEPNDTAHVANAINWYSTSCKKRTAADLTANASYSGACETVEDGNYYQTYAAAGVINYTDKIDVYDGTAYNGYTASVAASNSTVGTPMDGKLYAYDTFTDTEKLKVSTERPEFMYLAPNSITKVRVYIWLEGQDIDNYDFASLGKVIQVGFGFTKERYFGDDVSYTQEGSAQLPGSVIKDNDVNYDPISSTDRNDDGLEENRSENEDELRPNGYPSPSPTA